MTDFAAGDITIGLGLKKERQNISVILKKITT
jgi:hypothetical protein